MVCAEWTSSGLCRAKSRQRWSFYRVLTGSGRPPLRNDVSVNSLWRCWRLMSLLLPFDVVIWMTDGLPPV
ncbi:IS1 family transposase [Shigella flexneri]